MERLSLYLGYDQPVDIELTEDGTPIEAADYDQFSRFVLDLQSFDGGDPVLLDSDDHTAAFAWGAAGPGALLRIDPSTLEEVHVGPGLYLARLVGYGAGLPDGVIWRDYSELMVYVHGP